MSTLGDGRSDFEQIIQRHFQFLFDSGMSARGTRQIGQPPGRESGFVSRFEDSELRVEVGWNSSELSLGVLLDYYSKLSGPQRYVYFEPLVELLTDRREKAIVPYLTHGMSGRRVGRVMRERKVAFALGLESVAEQLGQKLQRLLSEVRSVSIEQINAYHTWIDSIR